MINPKKLFQTLKKNINFFSGVPDSVLKNFLVFLDKLPSKNHVIASNEGSAIGAGIGYHLSTSKIPCIYMQNSGLGNAINPIISIADKNVYSIPLFLLIGWRGSPSEKDEPQHLTKGKITLKLLKLLKIDFAVLNNDRDLIKIQKLFNLAKKKNRIVACLVKKNSIKDIPKKKIKYRNSYLKRSDFIEEFLDILPTNSKLISTTGYTSRELMEIRKRKKHKTQDFYMVGGMGHTASVANGFASHSNKKIFCLDGDGSLLMHLGSARTIGYQKKKNFNHIMFNNNSHESVGGQTTTAFGINFNLLLKSLGYKNYFKIKKKSEIRKKIIKINRIAGPNFIEVVIRNDSLKNLSRPKNLISVKYKFMEK